MRKVRYVSDLRRLLATALWDGAEQVSLTSFRWNIAGGCEDPVNFTLEGRPIAWEWWNDYGETRMVAEAFRNPETIGGNGFEKPVWVDMSTRCRKCAWCLRQRAGLWTLRAKQELGGASRTWFGTLTLRPSEHFRAVCVAESSLRKRGTEWAELSPAEQFQARHSVISVEITKWLKRIRKESEARLRYFLVAEAHKSGLPHYHILIHEQWLGKQVTERTLRRQWKLGFSKFNLVEGGGAAWYVAKYLSKASMARVRASRRYGKNVLST